jgi:ParB family chromosome partitioning protein
VSNGGGDSRKRRGLPEQVQMRHGSHFVEELTQRTDLNIGQIIPISQIHPDPNQPRTYMGDLEDLVGSVRLRGILEPILVRPEVDVAEDGAPSGFRIISGERRFRAAMEAGLEEVPAIVMHVGEEEALEIALVENLQRKDLTPFEEAEGFRALSERYGYTHEEIARTVGKSRTLVTESFTLLQVPMAVREAANALGITSKSTLLEVSKVGSEAEMLQIIEEIASDGLSRDDLRLRTRGAKPSAGTPVKRANATTLRFAPASRMYSLSLKLKETPASDHELIGILEQIIADVRMRMGKG